MPVVVFLLLLTLSPAVRAEDAASAFPQFCGEWMQKLEAREHDNVAHINWEPTTSGVKGDYVGYNTHEPTCITKIGTASVPVGKIVYHEVVYEKQGNTISEAETSAARPIESTEITEIFRYSNGKWIY